MAKTGSEDGAEDAHDINALPASGGSLTDNIAAAAVFHTTGLPPVVQRSLWKAIHRVLMAGAEWPASVLESRAKIATAQAGIEIARARAEAADINSLQDSRTKVNTASAKAAALRFSEDGLAMRAVEYHGAHLLREQRRREDILRIATSVIKEAPPKVDSANEIDEDVLEAILREGGQRSTEQFQSFFARILAGEIKQPGSFSISTVRALGGMNQQIASLFQIACDLSSTLLFEGKPVSNPRLISYTSQGIGSNGLLEYGLSYEGLYRLVEVGLIRAELTESLSFLQGFIGTVPFSVGSKSYLLTRKERPVDGLDLSAAAFSWTGPSFTKTGAELARVVDTNTNPAYVKAGANFYDGQGYVLHEITKTEGSQIFGEVVPLD